MKNNIELVPCKCGGKGIIGPSKNSSGKRCVRCFTSVKKGVEICDSETPPYDTEDAAAEAWNTMQTALQAGWTSEVPTEEGIYLFCGILYGENIYSDYKIHSINITMEYIDNPVYLKTHFKGFWFRINYPPPPQE